MNAFGYGKVIYKEYSEFPTFPEFNGRRWVPSPYGNGTTLNTGMICKEYQPDWDDDSKQLYIDAAGNMVID